MTQIKSFAKINLALEVTGKEANGYHTLNNVMCTLGDYYDEISIVNSVTRSKFKEKK